PHLRQTLLPLAEPLKQRQITLLGHAHLDMAWLWTVAETWKAAERTFQSVLNLQKDFPELTFAHTTPALYEWMEQNRPDLFAQIQEQVKAGKWEVVAGFWIEPELNLISGESIARQVLYGQRYIQEKFGKICPIAWVPDTFGFTWQLPQILKQGGVDYFVTQKLRWNDTTKFPYEVFQWRAPDGTQILSLMSAPIGEFIDPVKMANFAWELEQKTGLQTSLWLPGVGDHGGGPTRDMLEVARRWQESPFFPQMEFGTALEYLEEIRSQKSEVRNQKITTHSPTLPLSHSPTLPLSHSPLPIWNSELYLEYHRGCYTTHADQKQNNRQAENLLYEAELGAALASITAGATYPKAELENLWKKVLFNQFHDILPGSSITPVFEEANEVWESVKYDIREILFDAQRTITQQIALPTPPQPDAKAFVVFNLSNWERSQIVSRSFRVFADDMRDWQVWDLAGTLLTHQNRHRTHKNGLYSISFWAEKIPAIGYRVYWLCPCDLASPTYELATDGLTLENEFLRVTVDPTTGDLASIFDKTHDREVLAAPGNQLQAFEDKEQYWDAWNIDPNYAIHPLPPTKLLQIKTGEAAFKGGVDQLLSAFESRVRVEREIGKSIFHQTYILEQGSALLKIETHVDWQERHTLVKAAFPLNLEADFAIYEIPCGAIQRTTKPQTDAEKAQWEVPAMRWADLSDGNYGVSLLNDCKYGYDATPNQLRLTLLRGSEWPDPEADKGQHTFTYAIYPHAGDWKQAQTVRKGYELNMPLHVVQLDTDKIAQAGTLPPVGSLLDLGDENLVLMALKQAEDSDSEWILRCYECHGEEAQLNFQSDLNLKLEHSVDLLERPLSDMANQGQTVTIRPWQIASFKISTS
ncbi:MAG: alpha-mannosidase, partial [Oscillatoriales cyanobacterium C42_A2020_001]|nr:alpha-mannosidase [Leptolyngbyaceae cyanobacterium C42_A2020_001]